jgi:hypothetical protein
MQSALVSIPGLGIAGTQHEVNGAASFSLQSDFKQHIRVD